MSVARTDCKPLSQLIILMTEPSRKENGLEYLGHGQTVKLTKTSHCNVDILLFYIILSVEWRLESLNNSC